MNDAKLETVEQVRRFLEGDGVVAVTFVYLINSLLIYIYANYPGASLGKNG